MFKEESLNRYPNFNECQALWEQYQTPDHVIAHCKAVSKTASTIARRMNKKGFCFNISLIESAGWLHDIERTKENHWEKGARIAKELGYIDVAEIISQHMTHSIDPDKEEISELDLICIADRMVKEDHFVGPDERMTYIIEKTKEFPDAENRIRKSFSNLKILKQRIETIMDISVEDLMDAE